MDVFWWENDDHILYPLVMTNSSPWKNPPFLSSVNHLFLWAMAYHGYVSHNQMVLYQSRHQKNWANQQTPETFFTPVFWMWNIFVQPGTTVADPVNKTAGFVEFADNRGFDSAMRMREETGGAMVKNGGFFHGELLVIASDNQMVSIVKAYQDEWWLLIRVSTGRYWDSARVAWWTYWFRSTCHISRRVDKSHQHAWDVLVQKSPLLDVISWVKMDPHSQGINKVPLSEALWRAPVNFPISGSKILSKWCCFT